VVDGESRLESFEWENGYPTAKIHVTYNGPVTFPNNPGSAFSNAHIDNVNINRLVYFAYNSGRLISISTTMDITAPLTPAEMTELSIGSRQTTPTDTNPAYSTNVYAPPSDGLGGPITNYTPLNTTTAASDIAAAEPVQLKFTETTTVAR
jgi:hypothetical protein